MPKYYLFFWMLLLLALFGRFLFVFSENRTVPEGQISFQARLTATPSFSGSYQRMTLIVKNTPISITTSRFPDYQYGDMLRVLGDLKKTILPNGNTFYTMAFPHITFVPDAQTPIYTFGRVTRNYVSGLFHRYLPDIPASLMLGIVFGIKEDIPKSFAHDLQITGVYHIIAASGMNVTFVAVALVSVFGLFLKRQVSLFAALVGIFLYVCIAGFEPSIVRAALMAGIAFLAQIIGRQQAGLLGLGLTGWIMLFINPLLLSDVGFQLSFLSTLGILVLKPILDLRFERSKRLKRLKLAILIKDDLVTTTSAQLFTLPVLLSAFSQYGLLSILVNALVLWTIPILMILGSMAVLVSFLPLISQVILFLAMPLIVFVVFVITWFGRLGFVLTVPSLPGVVWLGYYLLLVALVISLKHSHEKDTTH